MKGLENVALVFNHELDAATEALAIKDVWNKAAETVFLSDNPKCRFYHNSAHYAFVGRPLTEEAKAAMKIRGAHDEQIKNIGAVKALAGAIHDLVYYGVDGGITIPAIREKVEKAVTFSNDENGKEVLTLKPTEQLSQGAQLVLSVFSLEAGKPLNPAPGKGMNELLSALYAVEALPGLSPKWQVALAAHIAATVPFGLPRHLDNIAARVNNTGLMKTEETRALMVSVAQLANEDVIGFSGGVDAETPTQRLQAFLKGSWALLPENNVALRVDLVGNYTPEALRKAMQSQYNFLVGGLPYSLDWQKIYHQSEHGEDAVYPSERAFGLLNTHASEVRENSKTYLAATLVSAALVEALAHTLGSGQQSRVCDLTKGVKMPIVSNNSQNPVLAALIDRGDGQKFDTPGLPVGVALFQAFGESAASEKFQELAAMANQNLKGEVPDYQGFVAAVRAEAPDVVSNLQAEMEANIPSATQPVANFIPGTKSCTRS